MSEEFYWSPDGRRTEPENDGVEAPNDAYEGPVPLERVLADELRYLKHHRHPDQAPNVVARSLIGLALSGGGIRSATTNLGVLQALARMRILPLVDYISTVSGGGYIGACLSSLLSWNGSQKPSRADAGESSPFAFTSNQSPKFSTDWETFPFRAEGRDEHGRLGSALVAHLRTHGNFLIARTRIFSRETLRGMGVLLDGTVFSIAGFAITLFLAAALYLMLILLAAPSIPNVLTWADSARIQRLERRQVALRSTTLKTDSIRDTLVEAGSSVAQTRIIRRDSAGCSGGAGNCSTTTTTTSLRPPTFSDALGRNLSLYRIVLFSPPVPPPEPATKGGGVSFWSSPRQWWKSHVPQPSRPLYAALLVGIIVGVIPVWWMTHHLRVYLDSGSTDAFRHQRGDTPEEGLERTLLRRMAWIGGALAVVVLLWFSSIWQFDANPSERVNAHAYDLVKPLLPAAMLLGAWLVIFFVSIVMLPYRNSWTRRMRSLAAATHAITGWGFVFLLSAGLAPALIYALRNNTTATGISGLVSIVGARLLVPRAGSGKPRFAVAASARRFFLNLFVMVAILGGFVFAAAFMAARGVDAARSALIAVILLAVYLVFGVLVKVNKFGAQYFYRDRLAETYLLSNLPDTEGRLKLFRDAMEVSLHELHGVNRDDPTWRNPAPYHLINAAVNLASSRDLTRKDRKSGYWLFSRLYCGSTHTGFRWTERYRNGETKLAHAVAVSGAAVSPAAGKDTFFALAFASVLFNVRLGAWMDNPIYPQSVWQRESAFWPWYLAREFFMNTHEKSRLVNVSDGGHTGDNLGIYALMQRRCKVVITCDAGGDPQMTFGALTEALRHAYVDMGISVDIDLSMLRSDPTSGLSRSHCAVGRIHYPDRPDQESWLIYLKNSLTGDEPAPMLNYKTGYPTFPHETTADQFFSDAQFESYRALGVHIAEETFASWVSASDFDTIRRHYGPESLASSAPESGDAISVTLRYVNARAT